MRVIIYTLNPPFGIKSYFEMLLLHWAPNKLMLQTFPEESCSWPFHCFRFHLHFFSAYCIHLCFLLVYWVNQPLLLNWVGANSLPLLQPRQHLHFKSGYCEYFKNSGSYFFSNYKGLLYSFSCRSYVLKDFDYHF